MRKAKILHEMKLGDRKFGKLFASKFKLDVPKSYNRENRVRNLDEMLATSQIENYLTEAGQTEKV